MKFTNPELVNLVGHLMVSVLCPRDSFGWGLKEVGGAHVVIDGHLIFWLMEHRQLVCCIVYSGGYAIM